MITAHFSSFSENRGNVTRDSDWLPKRRCLARALAFCANKEDERNGIGCDTLAVRQWWKRLAADCGVRLCGRVKVRGVRGVQV